VVSLREVGFFSSGEAELLPTRQQSLTRIAHILGEHGFEIRVEGHTDNVPNHRQCFKSNWELSTARATQVVSVLIQRYQFNLALVSAAGSGYGEFRPIADNDTEAGRATNRRVDLVVVGRPRAATQAPERSETQP
jgi:chemotaxis protein MotB